ncbi:MAG: FMN-binding negative transcriptional regulator [Betaproteobacteria bacterium]|jgi:transcriptional regulator
MSYVPSAFRVEDPDRIRELLDAHPLAVLVTFGGGRLHVSHLPLQFVPEPAGHGKLIGHFARANPQAQHHDPSIEALAVFSGPGAYVSPSGYPTKRETGKVVPTWNYAAVYAYGQLRFLDEHETTHDVVSRLTDSHESKRENPWAVSDAPADYVDTLLGAIRAFEFCITRIEGKWKMSQNRPGADRQGVMDELARGGGGEQAVLAEMTRLFHGRPEET